MTSGVRPRQTPLILCPPLCEQTGSPVYLKLESLQHTGSFKYRGAYRAVAALSSDARASGVVTASAGNHGAGLALASKHAGVPVTVFVPERTPSNKVDRIRGLGATLRIEGKDYDDSEARAKAFATESGARFVSAFDDDEVLAGNGGELGAEILDQLGEVAQVVVPIGGGGLVAGMAQEVCPRGVDVVGVQPENNCAMYDSLQAGHALCAYEKLSTIAEGCEGAVCERTYRIVAEHAASGRLSIALVSEAAISAATAFLYRRCGVVGETSAAVAIAGLCSGAVETKGPCVVVVSGGNIDASKLDAFLAEA